MRSVSRYASREGRATWTSFRARATQLRRVARLWEGEATATRSVIAASSLITLSTAGDASSATMALTIPSSARCRDAVGVELNLACGMARRSRSTISEKARPYTRNSSGDVRTTANPRAGSDG
jgi:hypothetical protein